MAGGDLFDISGKVAAVTGGGGIIGGAMALELARHGVKVAVLDLREDAARGLVGEIEKAGGEGLAVGANVLDRESMAEAGRVIEDRLGAIDILVNGAGGNKKEATTSDDLSFFDLPADALEFVIDLNLMGSVIPSQLIGRRMAERKEGCIVNISSMNSIRPLTRIVGYSAAKAAVNNFTQWLAVHVARNYSPDIRVNAIAPGFFETAQNRFLLRDESGGLTERGRQILDHTPQARFGEPADLMGALLWLVSPAARFVTGIVVPVDGGFSAYSGV
jgi:NAD(P)-dependent dehydrogenase (short-subunit alcohol dehydrogenase family)